MDGRREVIVKAHKGETVTAADGFYVLAGHNPGVHGAVLTEALSSRFTFQFDVATDYDLARALGGSPAANPQAVIARKHDDVCGQGTRRCPPGPPAFSTPPDRQ
jgi:hypothetical protein